MKTKTLVLPSIVILISILFSMYACEKKVSEKKEGEIQVPVSVFVVKKKVLRKVETIYGTFKGISEVDVYPKVGGKIVEIKVKEWDRVKKGDVIAVVDRDLTGLKYEPYSIKSPISGIVGDVYVEVGEEVTPPTMSRTMGTPVAKIVKVNPILVECDVPERLVYKIKPGLPVTVKVFVDSKKEFKGKVYRSDAVLNPLTRSSKADVILNNPSYVLMPGMYAEVKVILDEKETISVPQDAIMKTEKGEEFVWIVNEKGEAEKRFLITGIKDGINVEVIKGLKEGDKVIMLGKEMVKEGVKVNIRREEG